MLIATIHVLNILVTPDSCFFKVLGGRLAVTEGLQTLVVGERLELGKERGKSIVFSSDLKMIEFY